MAAETRRFRVRVGERWFTVEVRRDSAGPPRVLVDGQEVEIEVQESQELAPPAAPASTPPAASRVQEAQPTAAPPSRPVTEDARRVLAPMPGRVVRVSVKPGDRVNPGDEVCVVEAMKMEQSIRAAAGGVVRAVAVQPNQNVGGGETLVELE